MINKLHATSTLRATKLATTALSYTTKSSRLWKKVRRRLKSVGILRFYMSYSATSFHGWDFLMMLAAGGHWLLMLQLRSSEFSHFHVYALHRMANRLEDPPRSRDKAQLEQILQFRGMALPRQCKPLVILLLAHSGLKQAVKGFPRGLEPVFPASGVSWASDDADEAVGRDHRRGDLEPESDDDSGRRGDRHHGGVSSLAEADATWRLAASAAAHALASSSSSSEEVRVDERPEDAEAARVATEWLLSQVNFDSAWLQGSMRVFRDGVEEMDMSWRASDRVGSLVDSGTETCGLTAGGNLTGWRVVRAPPQVLWHAEEFLFDDAAGRQCPDECDPQAPFAWSIRES